MTQFCRVHKDLLPGWRNIHLLAAKFNYSSIMKAVAVFVCVLSFSALVSGRIEPDFTHRRMVDRSGDGGSSGSSSSSSSSPGKNHWSLWSIFNTRVFGDGTGVMVDY